MRGNARGSERCDLLRAQAQNEGTHMSNVDYDRANAGKADFEWTYNRLDPRAYFQTLGALDYAIPERAAPIFRRIFDAYGTARPRASLTVLDLGCSYGINAAVLKYGCSMTELRERYSQFDDDSTPPRDVLSADQRAFAKRKAERDLTIIGVDRAQFASSYAFWAGLLDDAIPENLEESDPSPRRLRPWPTATSSSRRGWSATSPSAPSSASSPASRRAARCPGSLPSSSGCSTIRAWRRRSRRAAM
jgi:hypothetical protein